MADIDDLLNDINNTETTKGKKSKHKAKAKKEETLEQPVPKIEEAKKVEVIKEETKPEPNNDDNEEAKEEEGKDKEEGGEKKKKVVKKVVVKKGVKGKKEDLFLKLAKEQARQNKIAEEEAEKQRLEEEKFRKEEEERLRKEEEERKRIEEAEAAEKNKLLEERKKLGLSEKEYNEMIKKKAETIDMLKKQGIESIDELLKVNVPPKKFKKKKQATKTNNDDNKDDEDKINEEEEANKRKQSVEQREKIEVKDNDDIDDWENEVNDEDNANDNKGKHLLEESENIVVQEKEKKIVYQKDDGDDKKEEEKKLRNPIICILGHVDTGKTKILDKLRNTNVQKGEAGGITQQIGATQVPYDNIKPLIDKITQTEHKLSEIRLPGLLIIDTPGHASFQNLRVRGQSLCDLAIVVIDIMHGLELQTIDSLKMVKERKTPFLIALNKVDQIYSWKKCPWAPFRESLEQQNINAKHEFNNSLKKIQTQIVKEIGLNTALYWENTNMKEYYNIIPTSAITGEGIPDLMAMSLYFSQTYMPKKLTYKPEVDCSVLEVKVLEKVGTTIDVVLVNGTLRMGQKIIIAGLNGPIKTEIKYILTPQPMKELRIKSDYVHHKEIHGSIGCKIFALHLEDALAGSPLHVYKSEKEGDLLAKEINDDCLSFLSDDMYNKEGRGVLVVASSLGALEAIMSYLQEEEIPVIGVNLGYVQKKDIIKIMTLHNKDKDKNKKVLKEDLCILAFDVHVNKDAQEYADKNGVTVLTADIIYHLKDKYKELEARCFEERKKEKMKEAIFPCKLRIIPKAIFNRSDPVIIGVDVEEGILKKDTPIYCVEKKKYLGIIESIQKDQKEVAEAFKNNSVSIRIKGVDKHVAFKTHFDEGNTLIANLTRNSIDKLKEFYKEDLVKNPDFASLIREIKEKLEIK